MSGQVASEGLRLAEFLAALALATDLGMGKPLEQALRFGTGLGPVILR